MPGVTIGRLGEEVASMKFKMRSAVIEIRGLCPRCAARERKS